MFKMVSSQGWQLMLAVSSRQATTCDFSIWLGLLAAWWSQYSHAPHLTPGFLKAAALPILFVRGVPEPARIQGSGTMNSTSWWRMARLHCRGAQMGATVASIFGNYGLPQLSTCSNVRVVRDHFMWKALWEIPLTRDTWSMPLDLISILKDKLAEKHIYLILESWGKHLCKYQVP